MELDDELEHSPGPSSFGAALNNSDMEEEEKESGVVEEIGCCGLYCGQKLR